MVEKTNGIFIHIREIPETIHWHKQEQEKKNNENNNKHPLLSSQQILRIQMEFFRRKNRGLTEWEIGASSFQIQMVVTIEEDSFRMVFNGVVATAISKPIPAKNWSSDSMFNKSASPVRVHQSSIRSSDESWIFFSLS